MPRPAGRGQRYVPGLDGLRALAVLAVIAYHVNLPWARGGMLGVGVFFTLSGYLITDLLLGSWHRNGTLALRDFWARRARRLLPALAVLLAAVSIWVALFDAAQLGAVRGQVLAAAIYASNWWTIADHNSYFSLFAAPLPLDHLWSLAIEEQFYLVWPWLLLLALKWAPRRTIAKLTLAAAAASALTMVLLYHPGYDPTRVYEGTDTRAFGLLVGAALAAAWPSRRLRPDVSPAARRVLDALGAAGLVGILALIWRTGPYSPFIYRGGLVLLSIATAAVVAAVAHPATRIGRALGWAPLRWLGVRSYGIYLWHWPVILLTGPSSGAGVDWPRIALQVAATIGLAALSWRYVEEPVRHGALERLWRGLRSGAATAARSRRGLAVSAGAAGTVLLAVLGLAGALPSASGGTPAFAAVSSVPGRSRPADPARAGSHSPANVRTMDGTETSCRSVAYIGDSTSDGEISSRYIPRRVQRLPAQLASVGVRRTYLEVSGGRSIVETLPGQANAATGAARLVSHGFHGCWIVALGTDDTANVDVGSPVGRAARIARMMSIIGDQPVLWVNTISLRGSGPYAEDMMRRWNQALMAAAPRYPTMRVFDWAALARPRWFTADGVHYTSLGSVRRAHLIARALATAFPAGAPPSTARILP